MLRMHPKRFGSIFLSSVRQSAESKVPVHRNFCFPAKDVVLYRDTNQHEPELLSVNEYLQEFLPANLRLRERQPHDRSSESVWVLVLCSASYCCRGPLNHWAPGWWREQLGDDEFLRLHEEAFSSLTERITEARLRCDLARIDYADCEEEQRDVAMATVVTWQEEMQRFFGGSSDYIYHYLSIHVSV